MIGIIDYGMGNYSSVRNAVSYLGFDTVRVRSSKEFSEVSHLILPGVGAFGVAMDKLKAMELITPLKENVLSDKKPFLGICVGMQVLATQSCEKGDWEGLDLISGAVRLMDNTSVKLPHIGWNDLSARETACPLFRDMDAKPSFYFVHSYHFEPHRAEDVSATSEYGGEFAAVVHWENIFGVQFHPEKSQRNGLRLLRNFCELE